MGVCQVGSLASGGMGRRLTGGRWWVRLWLSWRASTAPRSSNLAVKLPTPCPTPCRASYAQSQYPGNRGARPPGVLAFHAEAASSAAGSVCAGCRFEQQAVICSCQRPRAKLLRWRLRAAGLGATTGPVCRPALPKWPIGATLPRGSPRPLPGAGQKSDASGFTPAAGG